MLWYNPNLIGDPLPPWVYVFGAISVWMFQTLDALDGKQARRTGYIKPLGDLFDHGMIAARICRAPLQRLIFSFSQVPILLRFRSLLSVLGR